MSSKLNTAVLGLRSSEPLKDIWRFSTGPNVLKRFRFFPENGDRFSFNGGWVEGSVIVDLIWMLVREMSCWKSK